MYFANMNVCIPCMHLVPEEGIGSPRTGVTIIMSCYVDAGN